jgi:hypothetical protein
MAASLGAAAQTKKKPETVYRFSTPECTGRMSVQFYDRYSSQGFWFDDRLTSREFCLSAEGEEGKKCLPRFSGSIAIALYHLHSHTSRNSLGLRERVRTIDQDLRVSPRPPFERTLNLQGEVVSDIQAFGYDPEDAAAAEPQKVVEPWCLLHQDLYLDGQTAPVLIIHWKHTLSAITLLDVIPGDRTQLISG